LQNGSSTNLTVRWRTDVATPSHVRIGTNISILDKLAVVTTAMIDHVVLLTGLQPDTKYFYAFGSHTNVLNGGDTNHFFVTSPQPGVPKPTRFWVLGDSGTASMNQVNVCNAYEGFTGSRHTDLWLMLGDNAYNSGTDAEYQRGLFDIYTNMLKKSVLWPTLGNHDTAQQAAFVDTYPYFNIFTLPRNGEAGGVPSGTEHYYSFDHANIHFICLDSMTGGRSTNSAMYLWLTNDLAKVTADWTIVYFHHPPYTKGSHDSDTEAEIIEMRRVFLPVLEQAGVDLLLSGHSHCYERSFLIDQHYGLSTTMTPELKLDSGSGRDTDTGAYEKATVGPAVHEGTVYAVVGSSGQATGGRLNHPAMFVSLNNLGSLVVDVVSNRLDAQFVRETGVVSDYFTIRKLNHPPTARDLTFDLRRERAIRLRLRGSDLDQDVIRYETNSLPAHGRILHFNPATDTVLYKPEKHFVGSDQFTYRVTDGQNFSRVATVILNITRRIHPPERSRHDRDHHGERGDDSDRDECEEMDDTAVAQLMAESVVSQPQGNLRIVSVSMNEQGHCTITWSGLGNARYRVSYRDGDPFGVFTQLERPPEVETNPGTAGAPTLQSFTDDFKFTKPSPTARFFRVRVVP
jgi:hypothetical protein